MSARVKNMTQGRPLGLIVGFALPLMLGNVFQQLYTVVDTMVVGKALGVDALAALGAVDWFYWLVLGLIQGVTQGFGILIAKDFGAQQIDQLRRVIANSAVLSVFVAAFMLVLSQLAAAPVLRLLNTPERVIGDSMLYVRIMFGGIPIVVSYNLLSTILRSLGDSRTPLTAMILASLTNIALDLLFVMVFRWGIAGAAAATLLAQGCSCVFCLIRLIRIEFLKLKKEHWRMQARLSGRLLGLGAPLAMQNVLIACGGMIIQNVVNGYGVSFLAGFTATNKLFGLLEIAAVSYGYAMTTYTGQNLGAGKPDRIRRGMGAALLVALLTSGAICAFMLLLGKGILSLFLSGSPEEVATAMDVAYRYLATMSICLPILYVLHVMRSCLQGMENTLIPLVSGIVEFCMRTGLVLVLPGVVGENGIFLAEVSAWIGADLILVPGCLAVLASVRRRFR